MKTISTRELAHRTKAVRETLEAGEALTWVANGKVVAYLRPAGGSISTDTSHNWLARAKNAGASNKSAKSVSSMIYGDRA